GGWVAEELGGSVGEGGGGGQAKDGAAVLAQKSNFAAALHRLCFGLPHQGFAFRRIQKNFGNLPLEEVLFGVVAQHTHERGIGIEDAAVGRGDINAFLKGFEKLGEARFVPAEGGNVARENR